VLTRACGAAQDTPVADAKPDDIKDLLGGALFKALYKWMAETGPVYLLPTGPVSSFLVVSDPAAAQHVLQRSDNPKNNVYGKGLVAEVSEFLFGTGFATSGVRVAAAASKLPFTPATTTPGHLLLGSEHVSCMSLPT
jgi:carotenoid epsilon hydroxylase